MKFFIDTANLSQIQEAEHLGVLDGVTTNHQPRAKEPSISKQEPVMKQVLRYRYVRRVSVPHQQARTCNEAGTSIQVRS